MLAGELAQSEAGNESVMQANTVPETEVQVHEGIKRVALVMAGGALDLTAQYAAKDLGQYGIRFFPTCGK